MTAIVDRLKGMWSGVGASLNALAEEVARLAREYGELGTELVRLLRKRRTREDLTRPVAALIEAEATRLQTEVADLVELLAGGFDAMGERVERRPPSLSDAGMILSGMSAFRLALLLDRDRLAASLCGLAPSGGMTLDAIEAEIAAVIAKRERVRVEHSALVDKAAELTPPIRLDHLPDTVARRQVEAQAREREARERAETERERSRLAQRYGGGS